MIQETLVLFSNIRKPHYTGSLQEYEANGGYLGLKKALNMQPEEIVNLVKESGLRGRGGAGFPTGLKWSFMAKNTKKVNYLICNADEGEPGTCKDRELMLKDPHLLLEGLLIGCYAVNCRHTYIYVRGEFVEAMEKLYKAIDELKAKKYLGKTTFGKNFPVEITIHPGAGAYICGEETALLDSLEGKRGEPRIKPPFPAIEGFDACPTSVNNVETLCNLPSIIKFGAKKFQENGTPNNTGTRLVCISGQLKNPGVYEVKMGENLKSIIEDLAGGMLVGKKLKAVIPGGSSVPILKANEININYDFDSVQVAGSFMGSCGIIVIDEDVDMVAFLHRLVCFYNYESCGQCTPCREGFNWIRILLVDLMRGKAENDIIDSIYRIARNILGNTLCALGDGGAIPVCSYIEKFRPEFEAYLNKNKKLAKMVS